MKRLLLADVHAGLYAFEAVLAQAPVVDEIVFLGDIVGYGPHPAQCVDHLRALGARCILGNHDAEVLERRAAPRTATVGSPHEIWLRWTVEQLDDEQIGFLRGLPVGLTLQAGNSLVHAIHRTPGPYLHECMPDDELRQAVDEFEPGTVLCGHAHRVIDRCVDGKRLVCIPAIGQPRDGDPRAGYAVETAGVFEFFRVPYDIEAALADLRDIGLPPAFAARWGRFLRTGYDPDWSRER